MLRFFTILLLATIMTLANPSLVLASSPSNDAPKPKKQDHGQDEEERKLPAYSAVMPLLVVPVVKNGYREHYFYIAYRLVVTKNSHVERIDAKIPFLHDAIMRNAYKHGASMQPGGKEFDAAAMTVRIKEMAGKVLESDIVTDVFYERVDRPGAPKPPSHPFLVPSSGKSKPASSGH